jgi:hypothetical protein
LESRFGYLPGDLGELNGECEKGCRDVGFDYEISFYVSVVVFSWMRVVK